MANSCIYLLSKKCIFVTTIFIVFVLCEKAYFLGKSCSSFGTNKAFTGQCHVNHLHYYNNNDTACYCMLLLLTSLYVYITSFTSCLLRTSPPACLCALLFSSFFFFSSSLHSRMQYIACLPGQQSRFLQLRERERERKFQSGYFLNCF